MCANESRERPEGWRKEKCPVDIFMTTARAKVLQRSESALQQKLKCPRRKFWTQNFSLSVGTIKKQRVMRNHIPFYFFQNTTPKTIYRLGKKAIFCYAEHTFTPPQNNL